MHACADGSLPVTCMHYPVSSFGKKDSISTSGQKRPAQNRGSEICGKYRHAMTISVTKNTTMPPTIITCLFCCVVESGRPPPTLVERDDRSVPSDQDSIGMIPSYVQGHMARPGRHPVTRAGPRQVRQPGQRYIERHFTAAATAPHADDFQVLAGYCWPMSSGWRFRPFHHSGGTGKSHPDAPRSGRCGIAGQNHDHAGP